VFSLIQYVFSLIYNVFWLSRADDDDDDDKKTMPIQCKRLDLVPDSDALLILPVRPSALQAVVQVRRLVLVLSDLVSQLKLLPDGQPGGSAQAATEVMKLVSQSYSPVYEALRTLVVNCTYGENPDPMSRDGIPNRCVPLQRVRAALQGLTPPPHVSASAQPALPLISSLACALACTIAY
jgi:hypothetical protein